MREIRRRIRVLFYYYGKSIIAFFLATLVIISLLRFNTDIDIWFDQSLLNLATELVGALLVIYLGIDQLREQTDIESIPELPKRKIIREIAASNQRVQILDSWSYLFVDTRQHIFRKAVREAVERGASVQIIILRPGSAGLIKRADELREQQIDVVELHHQNMRWLHLLQEELYADLTNPPGSFEVRFRNELPESTMYAVDKILYHAPFARRDRADLQRHLRINIDDADSIGWGYIDDFNRKWEFPTATLDDFMMIRVKDVRGNDYFLYFEVDNSDEDGRSWFGALELKFDEYRKLNNADFWGLIVPGGEKEYEIIVDGEDVRCVCYLIQDSDDKSTHARQKLATKYGKNFEEFRLILLKQV